MFTDYLKGKIRYRTEVQYPEKFLNCVRMNASLKQISLGGNGAVAFSCFCCDEKTVEQALCECGGRIVEKKVQGLPKILGRLKMRPGIVAGFALSALVVFASTFFVWDIRIKGNETLSDEEIKEMLNMAGFSEGMLIKGTDVKKIANRVLINDDRISWIAINFEGTVATAEVKEASIPKRVEKKENVNIVASNNGIIMRVDALDGDAQVKSGDSVYKGQLLISSFSDKRTGGSILKGAKGFVWATTERSFCVKVPLEYSEKCIGDKRRVVYSVKFLGKTFDVPVTLPENIGSCVMSAEKIDMKLSEKIVLPFEAVRYAEQEYSVCTVRRTEEQALELARETAKQKLRLLSPDFAVASVREKTQTEADELIYTCTFEGVENIARELEFELS